MKKKKKDVGIIEHLFFPGMLRIRYQRKDVMVAKPGLAFAFNGVMPSILVGWVQDEVHVLYNFQSLS